MKGDFDSESLISPSRSSGAYVFLTGEEFPSDSNLTIEVIQRILKDVEQKRGKLPPVLYLQGTC